MQYMYLIYLNEQKWNELPPSDRDHYIAQGDRMVGGWKAQGRHHGGAPLHSVTTATTIRAENGQYVVTDGPFAETHEQLGGYLLAEAESPEAAVDLWRHGNGCAPTTIEVRALAPFPQPGAAPTPGRRQYMLLCYHNQEQWDAAPEAEKQRLSQDAPRFAAELAASGRWISGAPLVHPARARSIHSRDGQFLVTDGPFAETKEHLAGYILFHADNLDEAIAVGKRFHAVRAGTVEVRPVAVCAD
jgi:hypothetical protein